mmetsp:Transcript_815/g.963  ORF Transcript_815/g.963 Transcript_815/m.963 type:complete len:172 (-) Transcript_815:215-730(-)
MRIFQWVCVLVSIISVSAFVPNSRWHTADPVRLHRWRPNLDTPPAVLSGIQMTSASPETESATNVVTELCTFLGATPIDLLSLQSNPQGIRGVYINRAVQTDDILLQIPLTSCLLDSHTPSWFDESVNVNAVAEDRTVNVSGWVTRLTAMLLVDAPSGGIAGGAARVLGFA